jgi:hypothetical protein
MSGTCPGHYHLSSSKEKSFLFCKIKHQIFSLPQIAFDCSSPLIILVPPLKRARKAPETFNLFLSTSLVGVNVSLLSRREPQLDTPTSFVPGHVCRNGVKNPEWRLRLRVISGHFAEFLNGHLAR